MMAELNYTPQDILQQQFKTKMRGYDPEQVDEYLDNIIRDYESYQKELIDLQEENDYLDLNTVYDVITMVERYYP